MGQEIVIEAQELSKVYTFPFSKYRIKALDRLNLKIYKGEVFGLLGPNGSGKTTAMKIFLGLIKPTSGKAWVLDKPPDEVYIKNRIGFMPEESYLYRFLNAEETLDFYGRLFKMPKAERRQRIDELLELVGLTKFRKRPVKEYSKGMARRLGFAQAIINDPEVVFLDEPTSGLDPLMARDTKNIILDLKKRGKTVLMSSHLLADIENVCDRIAILYNGHLEKVGSVKELLTLGDMTEVTIKGLSTEQKEKLQGLISQVGGEIIDIHAPSETLETLFLRTIKKEKDSYT